MDSSPPLVHSVPPAHGFTCSRVDIFVLVVDNVTLQQYTVFAMLRRVLLHQWTPFSWSMLLLEHWPLSSSSGHCSPAVATVLQQWPLFSSSGNCPPVVATILQQWTLSSSSGHCSPAVDTAAPGLYFCSVCSEFY
jgi:hypothetical protein